MTIKMIRTDTIIQQGEDIEIYPVSDAHIGSKQFDEGKFNQLIRTISDAPNRFAVVVGDLIDNGTRSSVTDPFSATMSPNDQRKYAAELLWPIRDRILAGVCGNHEHRSTKDAGLDPMQLIFERLELSDRYRDTIAFIHIDLGDKKLSHKSRPKYCIAVTHGTGGGTTLGAGLNRAEPFAIAMGVDLLITGHTHKAMAAQTMRFEPDLQKALMVKRDVKILTASGFLDWDGYPARKMLKPVAIAPNYAVLSGSERSVRLVQG